MSLHQQLHTEMKDALKAREALRLSVLRGILSACTNENVTQKRKPDEELSDEEVLAVISRQAKQRKDSIEQFEKGDRQDLADKEKEELVILDSYLPDMMSLDEIRPLAEEKKTELGITDVSQKGQLMGALMKDLKGRADGNDVKKITDELLG